MKMRNGQHITLKFKRKLNYKNAVEFIKKDINFIVGKIEHIIIAQYATQLC